MNPADLRILVSISDQSLVLLQGDTRLKSYRVSTATNGAGEQMDSECTPRGEHIIAEKIGADAPSNTVFVGRRPTGELYSPELRASSPGRDWILTRILWLRGCEAGKNLGGAVDTYDRYVYLHGCPDDVALGKPGSRGCVRMANADIIELFDQVQVGTPVVIRE